MTAKTLIVRFPAVLCILLILFVGSALGQKAKPGTKLKWFGHAAFSITTPNGKVLLIDPWLTNPVNPDGQRALASVQKVDYILLTHGHRDHVVDAVEIAKLTQNATEFAAELKLRRIVFHEMKPGETITFQGNRIIQR